MAGLHKKYSISSISWLTQVCIQILLFTDWFQSERLEILIRKNSPFFFVVRCVVFALRRDIQDLKPEVLISHLL